MRKIISFMQISLDGFVAGRTEKWTGSKLMKKFLIMSVSVYRFTFISRKDAKEQSRWLSGRKAFSWRLAFNLCAFAWNFISSFFAATNENGLTFV
jgi:hypothetical protein